MGRSVSRFRGACRAEGEIFPRCTYRGLLCLGAGLKMMTPEASQSRRTTWLVQEAFEFFQTQTQNLTVDVNIEVQRYMMEPNIGRLEDPLQYWERQKHIYPHLYDLATKFLCTPASSVPCERVFSKAGEILSKKRNRLSPATVEKLLFLNKNHWKPHNCCPYPNVTQAFSIPHAPSTHGLIFVIYISFIYFNALLY